MSKQRIKDKQSNDYFPVSIHSNTKEPYCSQWKNDILLEFGHITSNKKYNFIALQTISEKSIFEEFLELINVISTSSWNDMIHRSKYSKGGIDAIAISELNINIIDNFDPNGKIPKDKKLYIYRFGSGQKYRLIGYKSHSCSRTFHILAFDLDYSLYDHGS